MGTEGWFNHREHKERKGGSGMKTIVAIDPGLSGGVAVRWFGKTDCWPMPETQGDLLERLRDVAAGPRVEGGMNWSVCWRRSAGSPARRSRARRCSGSASISGLSRAWSRRLEIRLVLVRPQVWQKGFGLGTASACGSKTEWKNKLKAEAQRRFPHLHRDPQDSGCAAHSRVHDRERTGDWRLQTVDHGTGFNRRQQRERRPEWD